MVHGSTHFAPKTRERTHRYDERTQGIDIRTRLGCERTRVSRRNPSGQLVAGWWRNPAPWLGSPRHWRRARRASASLRRSTAGRTRAGFDGRAEI